MLLGIIILTSLASWPLTEMVPDKGNVAATQVLGMPVLGATAGDPCWLSFGLGTGVVFVGIAGAGIVAIGLAAGGGLLFGSGQLAAGLLSVGQLAVGIVFTLAQLGVGLSGLGQLIFGGLVQGQVGVGKDGEGFLKQLNDDLNDVLAFRRRAAPIQK